MSSLETAHKSLTEQMDNKEQEIMSLKVHNSRDDSTEFQQVETRSQNKCSEDTRFKANTHSNKTQVTIIGTSNTNGIECQKLSSRYRTDKILAYTIDATQTEIQKLTTVLVLHSITNDIKKFTQSECVTKMNDLIAFTTEKFPKTKIIISLPTPRSDNYSCNNNSQLVSVMLKEKFGQSGKTQISVCDNSNLAYKGEPIKRFIDSKDGFHLSPSGVSLLASNIRGSVDKALKLPKRILSSNFRGRGRNYRGPRRQPYGYGTGQILEKDIIEKYSEKGDILLTGDLNARTGSEPNFIVDDTNTHIPINFANYDTDFVMEERVSQDIVIDTSGKELIEMCKCNQLRILNGRCQGDSTGKYTCYKTNGSSIVDYFLVSESLLQQVLYMHASEFKAKMSDCHCKLSLKLLAYFGREHKNDDLIEFPSRYTWDQDNILPFQESFSLPVIKRELKSFLDNTITLNYEGVNEATDKIHVLFEKNNNELYGKNLMKPEKIFMKRD
ncbi:unnamed protein product [Mytilus coruscus]|uniref:Endonuclease/exonuclease/phosphatase domain-containing protein n=1 Tax=Mytilus coruscus TaxID=42192 RepID=A0A6J8F0R5_MYTCO|nr:unnamed protein product [Mytilus coruscus]